MSLLVLCCVNKIDIVAVRSYFKIARDLSYKNTSSFILAVTANQKTLILFYRLFRQQNADLSLNSKQSKSQQ